jgi:transcriptional regulator with XRE-family HTH domain
MAATHMETPLDTPRSLRVRLGLRQEDLAVRAHVTTRTLTNLDAGRSVRTTSIKRVAVVLGVTPGTLLDAMERERVIRKSRSFFRRHGVRP